MKAGQTLIADDGHEVLLFPLSSLYITQTSSPSSFSHCCGHPFDCVGTVLKQSYYAPCTCVLYYANDASVGNSRSWVSKSEVWTPYGLGYFCFQFTHDNNPPYSNIGQVVKQGQLIGHTGTAGFVTGDHVHIDQAVGKDVPMISSGITCSGGNLCYSLDGSIDPTKIWYMNGTDIRYTDGLDFKTYNGGHPVPSLDDGMPFIYFLRRRW